MNPVRWIRIIIVSLDSSRPEFGFVGIAFKASGVNRHLGGFIRSEYYDSVYGFRFLKIRTNDLKTVIFNFFFL